MPKSDRLTAAQLKSANKQAAKMKNSAGNPRWMVQHEVRDAGERAVRARLKELGMTQPDYPRPVPNRFGLDGAGFPFGYARSRRYISKVDRHVWAQGADDGNGQSTFLINGKKVRSEDWPGWSGPPMKGDGDESSVQSSRKGRKISVSSHDTQPHRPGNRIGGAAGFTKVPLFGGQEWASRLNDEMNQAYREANRTDRTLPDATPELMRQRRRYLAPRVAGAALLAGGGGYAAYRQIKSRQVKKADYQRDPLKTSISEPDAKRLVGRHGLAGPLPKHLPREERMAAYEARYVASGGRKGEKWQHRARTADHVKNAGLGVATGGGVAWLGTRAKGYRSVARIKQNTLRHHADTVIGTGATVGGAAELYGSHARRRRASYASAPGGTAASTLRRMRAHDTARG